MTARLATLAFALGFAASGAQAAPVIFTDASDFAAAIAGGTVTASDNFDNIATGSPVSTFNSAFRPTPHVLTRGSVTYLSRVVMNGEGFSNNPDRRLGSNFTLGGNGSFEFRFGPASFFAIAIDPENAANVTLAVDGMTVGSPVALTRNESFLGILDTTDSFSRVTISGLRNTLGFTSFDDLQVGTVPVPEPATLALFGLGLLGLAAARRRA